MARLTGIIGGGPRTRAAVAFLLAPPLHEGEPHVATLDTPDTREPLALLMPAQAVAERVDAHRGRAVGSDVPLLPGESRGCDLAESVSALALRVRREIGRPRGKE